MSTPESFSSLQYNLHGSANDVIRVANMSLDSCMEREVIVRMEYAAIHPSDFGLINGSYGILKDLPAVGGREGVGTIYEIGTGVDPKIIGLPVSFSNSLGTWQEFVKVKEDQLIFLPSLVPLEQLAVSILNPMTAWRLLNDFEYLKPGDFIVQNAGNSAVGLSVTQFAKQMGIECISLVRSEKSMQELKCFGGGNVMIDKDESIKDVLSLTKGRGCVLGLNSIGGKSALRIAKCLGDGAVHVTFGAMDRTAIRFPTRQLIFNDIRFVGFWLDRWRKKQSLEQLRLSFDDVLQPLALKKISHPIDSIFMLSDYKNAFLRNSKNRFGKVLFCCDKNNVLSDTSSGDE